MRALAQGDLVEADAFTPVDLAELVEASAADARRRTAGARIDDRGRARGATRGWEPGLRMVADNLLTNALVHGGHRRARREVEVSLRTGAAARC